MNAWDLLQVAMLPECVLFFMSLVTLLVGAFIGDKCRHAVISLTAITLLLALASIFTQAYGWEQSKLLFDGMIVVDHVGALLKAGMLIIGLLLVAYAAMLESLPYEFYLLATLSLLGACVLVSAGHFVTLFVGLELLTLPLYAMIAIRRDSVLSLEAALKYFVISAIATGVLLYGASLFYAGTETLSLVGLGRVLSQSFLEHRLLFTIALVFVFSGVGFKLGLVPFHMWLPDVYEGAPTIMTLYIATISKLAALGLAFRVLLLGFPSLFADWQQLLMIFIVLSLLVGNIAALVQTNIKRMLAYSAIGQMGYLFLGVLTGTQVGYEAALFYGLTYALVTTAGFAVLMSLQSKSGDAIVLIEDLSGLGQSHPWHAMLLSIVLFSLAGIPPFVGFVAKLQVFQALIATGPMSLVIFALLMTVVAAYYYIYVVKAMYFNESKGLLTVQGTSVATSLLTVNTAMAVVLGIMPAWLMALCTL